MDIPERGSCLWSAVQINSNELCSNDKEPNINYNFKPYSWWFCCQKMEKEMGKSIKWDDHKATLYIFEVTGYDGEGREIVINKCPFCGKPIIIEQSDRLQYWKEMVAKRYK